MTILPTGNLSSVLSEAQDRLRGAVRLSDRAERSTEISPGNRFDCLALDGTAASLCYPPVLRQVTGYRAWWEESLNLPNVKHCQPTGLPHSQNNLSNHYSE